MSVIAKSLKRLKMSKKPNFNISGSTKRMINIPGLTALAYGVFIVLLVFIVAGYTYISFRAVNKEISHISFPSISSLQHRLEHERKLAMSVRRQPKGLDDLFVLKKFDKMLELAKKKNNLKYEGLYYFEKNDLDRAYALFKKYIKNHPEDYTAKSYMAFVLYRQNRYVEALDMMNKIDVKSYNLILDKAVVYEASGEYTQALNLYRQAYKRCKNPVVESRIRKKIIVLEYFLRNQDES